MKALRRLAAAAVAAAGLAAMPAAAYTVSVLEANGNAVDTSFGTPTALAVQYGIVNALPVSLSIGREAGDPDVLPLSALFDNFTGAGFEQLVLSLTGTTFAALGTANGTFGTVATVGGGGAAATIGLAPPEFVAVYVGDWLLDGANTDFGISLAGVEGSITLTASVIPEPGTYALLLGGLAALAFAVRRRS